MTGGNSDSRVDKIDRRRRNMSEDYRCDFCKPHRGENESRDQARNARNRDRNRR